MITKGQFEAQLSEAIIKFEKEYMGRGPDEAKAYIIDDLVLVRLNRVLTPAEKQLIKTENAKGRSLVKEVRVALLERARPFLNEIVFDITGRKVKAFTAISALSQVKES